MPPPVSSDDLRRASSFGEYGIKTAPLAAAGAPKAEENSGSTVSIVRRALKAMTAKRL